MPASIWNVQSRTEFSCALSAMRAVKFVLVVHSFRQECGGCILTATGDVVISRTYRVLDSITNAMHNMILISKIQSPIPTLVHVLGASAERELFRQKKGV